jgi:hypothetical protein
VHAHAQEGGTTDAKGKLQNPAALNDAPEPYLAPNNILSQYASANWCPRVDLKTQSDLSAAAALAKINNEDLAIGGGSQLVGANGFGPRSAPHKQTAVLEPLPSLTLKQNKLVMVRAKPKQMFTILPKHLARAARPKPVVVLPPAGANDRHGASPTNQSLWSRRQQKMKRKVRITSGWGSPKTKPATGE